MLRAYQQDATQDNITGARGDHWRALLTDKKEDLLRATHPRLMRLAQLRGVAPDAIEDVVQETLLEAWKHLDRLQSPEGFQFWIDEICRNVCRRYARRRAGELLRHIPLADPQQTDASDSGVDGSMPILDIADPHTLDLSEELSRQELNALLECALGSRVMLPGGVAAERSRRAPGTDYQRFRGAPASCAAPVAPDFERPLARRGGGAGAEPGWRTRTGMARDAYLVPGLRSPAAARPLHPSARWRRQSAPGVPRLFTEPLLGQDP